MGRSVEKVCHVCGARAKVELPESETDDMLQPMCARCFTPYLLTIKKVDDGQLERVLLTMYAFPSVHQRARSPVQIVCELAPTIEAVEEVRTRLHRIDVAALAGRTRKAEIDHLHRVVWGQDSVRRLVPVVEASVAALLRDAASGLLAWRIDHVCRTACAASEARGRDHRSMVEGPCRTSR